VLSILSPGRRDPAHCSGGGVECELFSTGFSEEARPKLLVPLASQREQALEFRFGVLFVQFHSKYSSILTI
jgi:hypothetical protein